MNNLGAWLKSVLGKDITSSYGEYFIFPTTQLVLALVAGCWWLERIKISQAFIFGSLGALGLAIWSYEYGYKRLYKRGRQHLFYLVYLMPACLAVAGYVLGVFIRF